MQSLSNKNIPNSKQWYWEPIHTVDINKYFFANKKLQLRLNAEDSEPREKSATNNVNANKILFTRKYVYYTVRRTFSRAHARIFVFIGPIFLGTRNIFTRAS